MNFLPPENAAVQGLLAVISDPKNAKKRLDELNKLQSDINDKIEEGRKLEISAKEAKADAEKLFKEQEAIKLQNEETTSKLHAELKKQIDTYDQDYREFQTRKGKDIRELEEQKQFLSSMQLDLTSRENSVAQREKDVSKKEQEVSELKKLYDDKWSKLKTIME